MKLGTKYRGRDCATGKWVNGWPCMINDKPAIVQKSFKWKGDTKFILPVDKWAYVEEDTVKPAIGICDRTGKMIYEGDEIRIIDKERNMSWVSEVRENGEVDYIGNKDYDSTLLGWIENIECEIVGHIGETEGGRS